MQTEEDLIEDLILHDLQLLEQIGLGGDGPCYYAGAESL